MLQGDQKNRSTTIHWSTHPQREQDETEKHSYDVNWQQKGWIIDCLKMYKISDEVINSIEKTMEHGRVELTAGEKSLAEVKIQKVIFQGKDL